MMNLKEARIAAKLTLSETAQLLHVPQRTYEEWEAGRRNPRKGADYYTELISAFGVLTSEGRAAVKDGTLTESEVLGLYRVERAKSLSKWGSHGPTWDQAFDRIPASVYPTLTAEGIADLVDAFVACCSDSKTDR